MTLDELRAVAKDALEAGAADYDEGEAWALACGLSLRAASVVGLMVASTLFQLQIGELTLQ